MAKKASGSKKRRGNPIRMAKFAAYRTATKCSCGATFTSPAKRRTHEVEAHNKVHPVRVLDRRSKREARIDRRAHVRFHRTHDDAVDQRSA